MKRHILNLVLALTLGAGNGVFAAEVDFEQQAKALVSEFSGQLKPRLQRAMAEGGAASAIGVCAIEAPAIAANLSHESGWVIKRVSTKNRNALAAPDLWEKAVLSDFATQLAAGVEPQTLVFSQHTPLGFRFAKAQVIEPLCLTCHGANIAPDVAEALRKQYPEDLATGYALGDLRGIFSLLLKTASP